MKNNRPFLVAAISLILGGGSLVLFMWCIFSGFPGFLKMDMTPWKTVFFDGSLCLIFFIQHSIMVRKSFKTFLSGFFPELYLDAVYSISSGITLLTLSVLWQNSGSEIVSLEGAFRIAARTLFMVAAAGMAWTYSAFSGFDPFGAKKLIAHDSGRQQKNIPFVVKGPFRYVRHPIYALMIVMIWSAPDISPERLTFNILWTLWILLGAHLEERDLVDAFGDSYIEYKKTTPMFIPKF